MASDEKPAGTNFASSSVVVAALVAAGTSFFVNHEAPLHGLRPAMTEPQFHQSSTSQDIEARLWQDPFAAIAKTIDAPGTAERCGVNLGGTAAVSPASHCLSPLVKETDKAKLETTQVIAVTLPGAPYMEDGEVRRRTRYAVSSGLERAGFVPEDEHHLGYFQPRDSDLTLPDVVPYEWFARTGSDQQQARHVLVLWVNEDALHGTPLRKLAGLADALRPENMRGVPVTIVGPYSSSLLLDMAKEACMAQFAEDVARVKPLSFYAYGATVDEKELYKQVPGCNISPELTVHDFFSNLGISLIQNDRDGRGAGARYCRRAEAPEDRAWQKAAQSEHSRGRPSHRPDLGMGQFLWPNAAKNDGALLRG